MKGSSHAQNAELMSRGPVKLIQWVKIAHSFLQSVLNLFHLIILGPVYTGPDKFGTGPLRDLIGFIPKRSHESSPKLFQIARPFTWDQTIHQIAKITAVIVERNLVVEDESPPKSQNIEE